MADADRPRAPPWLDLEPEEDLWLVATPSKNLLLAGVGVGFAVLIVGSVVVAVVGDIVTGRLLSAVMLAAIVVLLAWVYVLTERGAYVMTSDRVIVRPGLPWRSARTVPLARVADVAFEQSWWERWVHVGDVRFEIDGGEPALRFAFVEDPRFVFEGASERLASTATAGSSGTG